MCVSIHICWICICSCIRGHGQLDFRVYLTSWLIKALISLLTDWISSSCSRFPTDGAGAALGVVASVVPLLGATVIAVLCCLGVMVIAAVLCCLGAMGVTVPSVRHLPDKQTQLLMITVQRRTKVRILSKDNDYSFINENSAVSRCGLWPYRGVTFERSLVFLLWTKTMLAVGWCFVLSSSLNLEGCSCRSTYYIGVA